MSLYIRIQHTDYILPGDAPIATLMKHLGNLRQIETRKLGNDYVYVMGEKARIEITNRHDYKEIITEAEYEKRVLALRRTLPEQAGPNAHGKDITSRKDK